MMQGSEAQATRVLQRISERAMAANQANAALSTGPRTDEGKRVASQNAVTHGLLCEKVRIDEYPNEDREVFITFRDLIISKLEPDGDVEQMLTERIVSAAWRLRRVGQMEGLLLTGELTMLATNRKADLMFPDAGPKSDLAAAVSHLFGRGCYDQLSRYEARIERGMYKALHELQRLQARRRGEHVPPPGALDVEISGLA